MFIARILPQKELHALYRQCLDNLERRRLTAYINLLIDPGNQDKQRELTELDDQQRLLEATLNPVLNGQANATP